MSCSLYITVGIPGSGKSTGIKKITSKLEADVICPDDIREEVCGDASDQSQNEKVWKIAYYRLNKLLSQKGSVIFDATSVTKKARKSLIEVGKKYDCEIVALVFPVTLRVAIQRQSSRDRKVPTKVIKQFYAKFTMPSVDEGFDRILVYNS